MKLPKQGKPIHIPVPFELEEDIGLGDFIKRATSKLGITTCNGCEERAAILNQYVVLRGRQNPR